MKNKHESPEIVSIPIRIGCGEIVGHCMITRAAARWIGNQVLGQKKGPQTSIAVHVPSGDVAEISFGFTPAMPQVGEQAYVWPGGGTSYMRSL